MPIPKKPAFFRNQLGERGEQHAARFLIKQGYRILDQNYRCPLGEIDAVAEKAGRIYFIEIKTRTSDHYGGPFAAVDRRKQAKIVKLAQWYLKDKHMENSRVSFSVLAVDWSGTEPCIRLLEDAFDAEAACP